MPHSIRWLGYVVIAIFSFFLFLYWTFPYNVLKDRIITAAGNQLGGNYELRIGDFSPSFFTGAVLKDVKIFKRGEEKILVWAADKVRLRASLGTIFFGKLNFSFKVVSKGTKISGRFKKTEDGFQLVANIGRFDLQDIKYLKNVAGLDLRSDIEGGINIVYGSQNIINSGSIVLKLSDIELKKSELDLGEGGKLPLPDLVVARGRDSKIECKISKGVVDVTGIHFVGGDLNLNLSGQIRMRPVLDSSMLNLTGDFKPSAKLEQSIPLLFMIEKQKDNEGKYPISIRGRISNRTINVGEVTLPL